MGGEGYSVGEGDDEEILWGGVEIGVIEDYMSCT